MIKEFFNKTIDNVLLSIRDRPETSFIERVGRFLTPTF